MNRISQFYNECAKGCAVTTIDDLREILRQHETFDWEEFNKPIQEIDMRKVAESLGDQLVSGKWKTKQAAAPGKKVVKAAICKYTLDKSNVLGIGSGWSGSALVLRGLKSRFAGHSYKFGDETQQQLITANIEDVFQRRFQHQTASEKVESDDPCFDKKMCTVDVSFEVARNENSNQTQAALEQIKYIYLIQHLIALGVIRESMSQSPRSVKQPINIKGCMQKKTNDDGDQLLMLSLHADAIPVYHNGKACQLVSIDKPQEEFDPESQAPLFTDLQPKNVVEWTRVLSNTDMDVLVVIDSCCVKKVSGTIEVMPKLKVIQAVIQKQQQQTRRHIGLRLVRQ